MNIQKTVAKKAYQEIKKIITADNMMTVEVAINTALLKAFGLMNLGLIKIAMKKDNASLLSAYGYNGKSRDFEYLKAIRSTNFEINALEAKTYLISFIPKRMQTTIMYDKLVNRER